MTARGDFSRDEAYFDRLYEANPDPWNFAASPYERRKYRASLQVLGKRTFAAAFEVGCSIGVFTALLAPRCQALLAVDTAAAPLRAAAQNCAVFAQARFEKRMVPHDWPTQKFDLIVLSEMLYFLNPADVRRCAKLARETLLPGGCVLLVNYTAQIDEPCSGDEAAALFIASSSLPLLHHRRDQRFRIDLLGAQHLITSCARAHQTE